jgi:stage V sporulation protein G
MDDNRSRGGGDDGTTRTVPCKHTLAEDGLCITEIRISTRHEDKLKAFVSITLNNALVVRGIKVIEGRERLFVAMPSRARPDGSFQDVVHPINQEARSRLEGQVLTVYRDVIENREI